MRNHGIKIAKSCSLNSMVLLVDIYTGSVATMTNLVVINAGEPASLSSVLSSYGSDINDRLPERTPLISSK